MVKVEFGKINFAKRFDELDVGTYFEFEGELFVKITSAKEGNDEVNAFDFVLGDTTFFENNDKVTPIPTEAILISVGGWV